MSTYNQLTIVGYLGSDCESKYMPDGNGVVNFSLAYQDGFGEKAETVWVDCAWYGERAMKAAQYLLKSKKILVTGKLKPVNVFQRADGTFAGSLKMKVLELTLLGNKPDAEEEVW